MKTSHLIRRPPMKPMRQLTWCRIPLGDTGVICWRIWMRDHRGAQQMTGINVGPGISRRTIAERLRKAKSKLSQSLYELAAA